MRKQHKMLSPRPVSKGRVKICEIIRVSDDGFERVSEIFRVSDIVWVSEIRGC